MQGVCVSSRFHGLPAIELRSADGARATVLAHGAHLVSWIPAGGEERLFLSNSAVFDGTAAIRGGVPVIFPQFAMIGSGPRHGFARNTAWSPIDMRATDQYALTCLRLESDEIFRVAFPHLFGAELTVSIGGNRLDIELEIENRDRHGFSFTCALHTYLRVAEIEPHFQAKRVRISAGQ